MRTFCVWCVCVYLNELGPVTIAVIRVFLLASNKIRSTDENPNSPAECHKCICDLLTPKIFFGKTLDYISNVYGCVRMCVYGVHFQAIFSVYTMPYGKLNSGQWQ